MEIRKIQSFLTYPGKNLKDQQEIAGATIKHTGKVFRVLSSIFNNAEKDCNVPIAFSPTDGKQDNEVRSEIVKAALSKRLDSARRLATRLQRETTSTSGMGLLFITIGTDAQKIKIVVSRFPADEGIVAEKSAKKLTVEFVDQVFLKSAHAYKAALYVGNLKAPEFWKGFAVDKQMTSSKQDIADYWIYGFLQSDLQTTPKQGTKQLARALRSANDKTSNIAIKQEITGSTSLSGSLSNKVTSIRAYCTKFGLSSEAKKLIFDQVKNPNMLDQKFKFDKAEFTKNISFKFVELSNGAILGAQTYSFDSCFETQSVHDGEETKYTTTGTIVNEKLRRTK